jgi:hypothetical protein
LIGLFKGFNPVNIIKKTLDLIINYDDIMDSENIYLIAPCGMNCASCMNYLRERNKCPRCRGSDTDK